MFECILNSYSSISEQTLLSHIDMNSMVGLQKVEVK